MMKTGNFRAAWVSMPILAGIAMSGCTSYGQGKNLDPKIHINYTPYDVAFYRDLMTGRVNLFEGIGKFNNVVQGSIYHSDGKIINCSGRQRLDGKIHWIGKTSNVWSVVRERGGARIEWDYGVGYSRYASKFYNPETGDFTTEILYNGSWIVSNPGQIQDTWPRALADACPNLKLPPGIRINEKQTSLRMDELRRQDPDAPIRHFPGSQYRAPGRTGLGASRGRPTTTAAVVEAYLAAQEGNILKSPSGRGYVYTGSERGRELWVVGKDGLETEFTHLVRSRDGSRMSARVGGREVVYAVGYPFPLAPTGHRHAAWQLTDILIASAEPAPFDWMGERYRGHRFLLHDKAVSIVTPDGDYRTGRWRWTQGRLQVTVDGEEAHARDIGWRELARELGVTPRIWTRSTPNRL